MEDNSIFLKYIYQEDIYIIDEPAPVTDNKEAEEQLSNDKQLKESSASTDIVEEPNPVVYFGKNEKGILILVEDLSDELLNQTDLDLLMKIVESGLKYSKNDFALVNTAKYPINQILEEISYSYLISFGIDLSEFYSNTTPYTIHEVDKSLVLFSEPLSFMRNDKQRKGKLWLALKSMFNIS